MNHLTFQLVDRPTNHPLSIQPTDLSTAVDTIIDQPAGVDLSNDLDQPIDGSSTKDLSVDPINVVQCSTRQPKYQQTTLSQIKDKIQPLDYLLFRGHDIISNTIGKLEEYSTGDGSFTHVEVVVCSELLPDIPQLKPGKLYTMASLSSISSPSEAPDILTGKGRFGVQIRDLDQVIERYKSSNPDNLVGWCRNQDNLWLKDPTLATEKMEFIYHEYGNKIYEYSPLNLFAVIFRWLRPVRTIFQEIMVDGYWVLSTLHIVDPLSREQEQMARMFCSKFAVLVGKATGNIPDEVDPQNVSPIQFLYPELPMVRFLDDPILIDLDPNRVVDQPVDHQDTDWIVVDPIDAINSESDCSVSSTNIANNTQIVPDSVSAK